MWAKWIASACANVPEEDLLAVWFGDGEGFFAVGNSHESSSPWQDKAISSPVVGGKSFFGKAWGAWQSEEFTTPKFFVYNDGKSERCVSNGISLAPHSPKNSENKQLNGFRREHSPEKHSWIELCEKIENGFNRAEFQKIVPARSVRTHFSTGGVFDLGSLWEKLLMFSPENSHRFLWKKNGEIFLGASPELLFSLENGALYSQAVAGTAVEGRTNDLYSDKTKREHAIVVEDVRSRLAKVASSVHVGQCQELKYGRLHHLFTPVSAVVPPRENHTPVKEALDALHPTSAVGGMPAKSAHDFLIQNEGWERGYFASPIGFSFNGNAKFLVAIRSARLTKSFAEVFAGAGYVPGSTAADEWDETRTKMQTMERVLGIEEIE